MTESDRERFTACMAALASTFGREADRALLLGYWMALDDLALADVERATRRAMRECRFMPTGAELRELAGLMNAKGRAVLAWDALCRGISHAGYYRSVSFDDPLINAAVANLGGWEHVCGLQGDDARKWLRKDFERVYESLCTTGASSERCGTLVGHADRVNGLLGYEIKEPVLIETGLPPHRQGLVYVPRPKTEALPLVQIKGPSDA